MNRSCTVSKKKTRVTSPDKRREHSYRLQRWSERTTGKGNGALPVCISCWCLVQARMRFRTRSIARGFEDRACMSSSHREISQISCTGHRRIPFAKHTASTESMVVTALCLPTLVRLPIVAPHTTHISLPSCKCIMLPMLRHKIAGKCMAGRKTHTKSFRIQLC